MLASLVSTTTRSATFGVENSFIRCLLVEEIAIYYVLPKKITFTLSPATEKSKVIVPVADSHRGINKAERGTLTPEVVPSEEFKVIEPN